MKKKKEVDAPAVDVVSPHLQVSDRGWSLSRKNPPGDPVALITLIPSAVLDGEPSYMVVMADGREFQLVRREDWAAHQSQHGCLVCTTHVPQMMFASYRAQFAALRGSWNKVVKAATINREIGMGLRTARSIQDHLCECGAKTWTFVFRGDEVTESIQSIFDGKPLTSVPWVNLTCKACKKKYAATIETIRVSPVNGK